MSKDNLKTEYKSFRSQVVNGHGSIDRDLVILETQKIIKPMKIMRALCVVLAVASIPFLFIVIGILPLAAFGFAAWWFTKRINLIKSFADMARTDNTLTDGS